MQPSLALNEADISIPLDTMGLLHPFYYLLGYLHIGDKAGIEFSGKLTKA